jgi:deferrochelatase/peroxidase EfeB
LADRINSCTLARRPGSTEVSSAVTDNQSAQEGIFYQRGVKPPDFYMLLLLDVSAGADPGAVREFLGQLWKLYRKLKRGIVPDLVPATVPGGGLRVLFGFGKQALTSGITHPPPADHGWKDYQFRKPRPFGGPIYKDESGEAGINYAKRVENHAHAAVAIQFTADTMLAVERAVVETWKMIEDHHSRHGSAPLTISAAYAGSQRDDGRSWIDFHDGLSNVEHEDREGVIFIGSSAGEGSGDDADDPFRGGTYMSFMRLGIDLKVWRDVGRDRVSRGSPSVHEQIVGRGKIDGVPLTRRNVGRAATPGDPPPDSPRGLVLDPIPESHIGRSNREREDPPSDPTHNRIFRQGYPYFESGTVRQSPRVGLNFVAFHKRPGNVMRILRTRFWLARDQRLDAKGFGGPFRTTQGRMPIPEPFIIAYAAGMFFVPPRRPGDAFPGDGAPPGT